MLVFDKNLALLIALLFGISGLPLSWWAFRKDEDRTIFEKAVFGWFFGFVLIPLLFSLEFIFGILYSPALIYANWLILFGAGVALLAKDKAIPKPNLKIILPSQSWISQGALALIMLSILLIGLSAAGVMIFELDPYFYMYGVQQIVQQGSNFYHDSTAWYPLAESNHLGQPLWKYAMASWFSLYNGAAPFSQYALANVGGIYPPITGALSAFFAYFLFAQIFNRRVGVLAAGLIAFMPTMILKFQGGDSQIEPYNVAALFFLLAGFAYMMRRPKDNSALLLAALSYVVVTLVSNLGLLVVFSMFIFFFLAGIAHFLFPSEESKAMRDNTFKLMAAIVLTQLVYALILRTDDILASLRGVIGSDVLLPLAAVAAPFAITLVFSKAVEAYKIPKGDAAYLKVYVLIALAIAGVAILIVAPQIGFLRDLLGGFIFFGSFSAPLGKTIAEQAPGSEFYSAQFGFMAAPMTPLPNPTNDAAVSAISTLLGVPALATGIATAAMNLIYSGFVLFMNSITASSFQHIEKGNSMMSFFLFFSLVLMVVRAAQRIMAGRPLPYYALLLFPYVSSVSLLSFGKQKLAMYLGIATVLAAAVFWGECERLVSGALQGMRDKKKEKSPSWAESSNWSIASWVLVILFVLGQFGSPSIFTFQSPGAQPSALYSSLSANFGLRAQPLLSYSMTPRVQDSPAAVLPKLQAMCAGSQADQNVCRYVANWNQTAENPVLFYSPDLCVRSLWQGPMNEAPADLGHVYSYRCSFVNQYWLDSMVWINKTLGDDDRVISWWDYGHWINFFGQKKSVLRNEHASLEMIGRTAYSYLHGSSKDLRDTMRAYGSKYALVDVEIVGSGSDKNNIVLGGKYGALNYLGCAWLNKTSVAQWPGQSRCEQGNYWEEAFVPITPTDQTRCTISESNGISGIVGLVADRNTSTTVPRYCFTEGTVNGQRRLISYDLNAKDENGDLKMRRALWIVTQNDGQSARLEAFYTKDEIWPTPEGGLTGGWEDRTTSYYDSNLYSAFFFDSLEGFDLVYNSPQIRIFKMQDEYYNSQR